jgi:hypothetical protein
LNPSTHTNNTLTPRTPFPSLCSGALLEGLVASIGGVDASLSKAASGALLSRIDYEDGGEGSGAGAGAGAAPGGLRARVAEEFVALWQRELAAG